MIYYILDFFSWIFYLMYKCIIQFFIYMLLENVVKLKINNLRFVNYICI